MKTVRAMGNSSGIRPMPRARAAKAPPIQSWRTQPIHSRTTPHTRAPTTPTTRTSRCSCFCSGVGSRSMVCSATPMRPMRVAAPVATTSATPCPATASVPAQSGIPRSLSTGQDSPVSSASSTRRPAVSSTRASAATRSPSVTATRSPGTNSWAAIRTQMPSRITLAWGTTRSARASSARSRRRPCTTTSPTVTAAKPPSSMPSALSPTSQYTAAPASSRTNIGSRSTSSKVAHQPRRRGCGRRLGPWRCSRLRASGVLSPRGDALSAAATSAARAL